MIRWCLIALAMCGGALLGGCGSYPLNANMEDAQINTVLGQHFHTGMTVSAVQAELSTLRVHEGDTLLYPSTPQRPEVLLARLWPPGGFWMDPTGIINFVDISFVFGSNNLLERWVLFDDRIRYMGSEAVLGPSREPMTRVPPYPGKPPPPLNPLQGTN